MQQLRLLVDELHALLQGVAHLVDRFGVLAAGRVVLLDDRVDLSVPFDVSRRYFDGYYLHDDEAITDPERLRRIDEGGLPAKIEKFVIKRLKASRVSRRKQDLGAEGILANVLDDESHPEIYPDPSRGSADK